MLVVLALALVALAGGVPVWVRTAGTSALLGEVDVAVTGTEAAPGVPAAALVLLAAGLAMGLAGRLGRWVVVAVVLLAGVLLTVSAAAVVTDPAPVARTAVAAATGVDTLAAPVVLTPWPWVVAGTGVLVVGAGCWLAATSRRWARPSERHVRAPEPGTGASTSLPPPAAAAPGGSSSAVEDDDQAAWDALTRGQDPT